MEKKQAAKIVKVTFENSFDKTRFTYFIKNLLNQIEEAPFTYKGNYIHDSFKEHITSLERIGKYNDGEHKIDILIVQLKKETSIERARTMQRNYIAKYLNGSRGGEMKDAALVAFVSPDNDDWRFSLVKMDYRFEKKDGKTKIIEDFTPARRWSFLVGTHENSHTAQSRLMPLITNDDHNPTLSEIEDSFNIEKVTKKFFIEYRDLFLKTKEELDKVIKDDTIIKNDFDKKGVNTVDFAKKLLGQIVFLYFLQKKGWFGVQRDSEWGTGSKQFLRELFKKKHSTFNNFFNDILEPLFYDALRIDRSHDDHYYSHFNCKIPFLNGGLFDPMNNYDWVHTDIFIPNELFSNTKKTKEGDIGDGILDIFDRYNFTVKEDEPLEKEVAIDPELLGKAYEKFNAIRPDNYAEFKKALKSGKKGDESKFNKQYGVYYTPREIVHYMCQQSLINYLYTELNKGIVTYEKLGDEQFDMFGNEGKTGQLNLTIAHNSKPEILKEEIETFVHYGEHVSENEAHVEKSGKETGTYYYKIPENIRKSADDIDQKLAGIKVCDPAIGSGAFPVGMMSEIVRARNALTPFIKDQGRTVYHFKRDCIEKSLYGVDIDPGAIEIAKLRLWLSLVVDEDDIKQIKPLPNLDYKIVCGNSLLGVEKNLFNSGLFEELEKLKPLYFNETNPTKKQEYKKQIDGLISQITNGHSEFDFEVYFSEVFHSKGGFDVVIGNPPYGFRNVLSQEEKKYFRKSKSISFPSGDIAELFIIFSNQKLTSKNGILTLIIPKKSLYGQSWKEVRELWLKNSLIYLMDVSKAFENVLLEQVSFSLIKENQRKNNVSIITLNQNDNSINNHGYFEIKEIFSKDLKNAQIYKGLYPIGLMNKLFKNSIENTENIIKGEIGISNITKYLSFEPKNNVACVKGIDINNYGLKSEIRFLNGTIAKKYLSQYQEDKIVAQEIIAHIQNPCPHIRITIFYDANRRLINDTCVEIKVKDNKIDKKFLLAYYQSTFCNWYAYNFIYNRAIRTMHFIDYYITQIPIPKIIYQSINDQKPFINIVNKILSLTQSDGYQQNPSKQTKVKEYEKEIDRMVYELYGLTPEEIKIVEGENQ